MTTSATYSLQDNGDFVVERYHAARPFSSFLPGIAGRMGIPMWVFYVNRGQGVASMGIRNKQQSILEFLPANRAWQLVGSQGFRTFLKLERGGVSRYFEPFQDALSDRELDRDQRMRIRPWGLGIEEVNRSLGLELAVEYTTVADEPFAGLLRRLRIRNTGDTPLRLEALDGLPLVVPCGVDNHVMQHMRRTIEAFVEAGQVLERVPFFRAKVEPADRPDVRLIQGGHFYLSRLNATPHVVQGPAIVDPERVFGNREDFAYPERFLDLPCMELSRGQIFGNRLPCALTPLSGHLDPGEELELDSLIGHAHSMQELAALLPRLEAPGYLDGQLERNRALIGELCQSGLLVSGQPLLDRYAAQNYLDNVMRGGHVHSVAPGQAGGTLHLYSRKHGDPERDYNDFQLLPTPYSQGNGNYRDVNQNRRSDLFFNPDLGSGNVEHFYQLLQLDGFNPLVIGETRLRLRPDLPLPATVRERLPEALWSRATELLRAGVSPGDWVLALQQAGAVSDDWDALLAALLPSCDALHVSEHGEGYWIDHWTYNLDLLENFQAVFPEQLPELLFERRTFSFHQSRHRVLPRAQKVVLYNGQPRQLDPVLCDDASAEGEAQHGDPAERVLTASGEVYRTTLFASMLCLITNKLASLDPAGVGVEMEAGKPGWYDALNGLPGLFGSSLSEALEIRRHIQFLQPMIAQKGRRTGSVRLFVELADFLQDLAGLLKDSLAPEAFWDRATSLKESYRDRVRNGLSGHERELGMSELQAFFQSALHKLEAGLEQALDENGIPRTYFVHEALGHDPRLDDAGRPCLNRAGLPCVRVTQFKQRALPLFLEGPVHLLRCRPGRETAARLLAAIEHSDLFDGALGMFKVNASLEGESMEIGRCRVFSRGWLENESIWLHMEYKFMLELLRNELHQDFYRHFPKVFVPFFDPAVYGRSVLENSSFLVSSVHPDTSLHGAGFVARLSGATAEFIQICSWLTMGAQPFRLDPEDELQLVFEPVLQAGLFTREERVITVAGRRGPDEWTLPVDSCSFMFLGTVLVTYHNPRRRDTFGENAVRPCRWTLHHADGRVQVVVAERLSGTEARAVRARDVRRVEILLD
ncbi:MAG: hypothetical protein KDC10_02465 [Calditrichaeota bacterium]|nr:hypothetical protein [Calditrichota bacterium]